ncbi:endonuclease/exonuclease/phosphatase family protein [Mesorhizobium yinganensis]|uniref:endonuclease/exonuclease/phosphatase family protein n=1 Tax=Mesorhizobium yinganensis TaxID=3157707 RepID=UPI0032B80A52
MPLRIVSLNAWGGRLYGPLMRFLADADPDVLCLQEVVRTEGAQAEWLTYRDQGLELAQRANLFEEIYEALTGHEAIFCPVAAGDLFDGDIKVPSQFGLATFVRKSLPVIGQAQDFVHGDFAAKGWGEHPRARNAHCVRLFDPDHGSALTVAHMHGLRDLAGKADTSEREQQAKALARLIGRIARASERLIVCGDFNVLPGSSTFEILGGLGLSDLVVSQGYTDTRTSYYDKPTRFADYMLVTPNVDVLEFTVVDEPEVSDHRALMLEIG